MMVKRITIEPDRKGYWRMAIESDDPEVEPNVWTMLTMQNIAFILERDFGAHTERGGKS